MDNILKVVFVKYAPKAKKCYMFECNEGTYFDAGDTVIVLNADGDEIEAKVVDTERFDLKYESDRQKLNRLLLVSGAEMPFRKIVGKVERTYFNYKEDKKDE